MIKNWVSFVACIIFLAASHSYASPANTTIQDNTIYDGGVIIVGSDESSLTEKYLNSLVPGILIGSSVGVATAFFDHIVPGLWPITWLISYEERLRFVNHISADMHNQNTSHSRSLMDLSSFVATWIAYYYSYIQMHGCPPF